METNLFILTNVGLICRLIENINNLIISNTILVNGLEINWKNTF